MDRYPLRIEAHRDESPSRWLWLVKWLLLLPHYLALLVLWTGLVVLTLVAYLAVLITGRYPEPIRAYNVGVLRWTWRVGYYGYQALGTDAYPPFTLADVPEHPARLRLDEAVDPPRWLPLAAWLFAVPHLIILGAVQGVVRGGDVTGGTVVFVPLSVTGALLLVVVAALLFTGRYPGGLHDLLVGVARWNLRVLGYLTLITPRYPPFRLDQGGFEPDPMPTPPVEVRTPRSAPAAGPVIALIAGVLLLAPATGLAFGGGALLALDAGKDRAGYVSSPEVRLASDTAAITAEHLVITDTGVWARQTTDFGGLTVTASAPSGRPLFIGIGPQSAVDAWLAGTGHDQLTGFDNRRARYDRADGPVRAVGPPGTQDFWVARTAGTGELTLRWEVTDGEYAVVIANAGGTPGTAADVRAAVQVPDLTGIGLALLAAGLLTGLVAVGLIVAGGIGLGRRHSGPPPGPPAAGPRPTGLATAGR
ncbi:hypothetical protein GCM10010112_63760 [Actinoplanes lobatus]|uniref:DUF4389 domain-containing protein n=1 Tax=Actinoplanes lobatus TaxID=113568 RepID=A0A7W7MKR5_9ACTN|nr:DUF4389 domain-containing protein [Actinoplanes lobatus]MBB4753631.1 hypothetical protein [Actinoplanes lobatus]GGN84392.1 hypothetical protein GCM10010112_63760 [Actinoplanes lobatus]GIE38168.1 hypothetical protein Alo02nite_10660 [Actinoplanes lobatus]